MFIESMNGSIVEMVVSDPTLTDPTKITLEEKWNQLKKYIEISKMEDLQENGKIDPDTYLTCDANWGFDLALIWVRDFMDELETNDHKRA